MGRSIEEEIYCAHTINNIFLYIYKYAPQADNNFTPIIGSTAAFSSEFGKGLGGLVKGENLLGNISNSTLGIAYYIFMAVISYGSLWENINASKIRVFLSIASGLPCFWLAYVLM